MVIYKYSFNFIKGHIIKTKYKHAFKHSSNGKHYVVMGRETIPIAIEIVSEINNTIVKPEDQLSDLPYLFDLATQKLTVLEEVTEYE